MPVDIVFTMEARFQDRPANPVAAFSRAERIEQVQERGFALSSHHEVDEVFGEGLVGEQRRVPSSEDYGQFRTRLLREFCNFNRTPNHGSGQVQRCRRRVRRRFRFRCALCSRGSMAASTITTE